MTVVTRNNARRVNFHRLSRIKNANARRMAPYQRNKTATPKTLTKTMVARLRQAAGKDLASASPSHRHDIDLESLAARRGQAASLAPDHSAVQSTCRPSLP